jgi:membrane protein DedA with SNARE-associated domain
MEFVTPFVEHWGYAAVFAVVLLGSVGFPLPEETILMLAGYLTWRGDLSFPLVFVVGVVSACLGDNLGYWLGRRVGARALHRQSSRSWLAPATLEASQRFLLKHGAPAIFLARFVPGLRFAAGPVSGLSGVPASSFFTANILGALCYVPLVVGLGYAIGRGAGPRLERIRATGIAFEHIVLLAALAGTLVALLLRARRAKVTAATPPDDIHPN